MAMFNFELGGKEEPRKMRSYIDIDSAGKPTARIYADEYDSVKANPDFAPFLSGAGQAVNREQTMDQILAEGKMDAVQKRIDQLKREAVAADVAYSKSQAEGNLYWGPDILKLGKTYQQKAEAKRSELQKALEEEAALSGGMSYRGQAPEVSAPVESVGAGVAEQAPSRPATTGATVRVKSPSGKIANVPVNVWSKDAKKYIEQGYQLMP